MGLNYNNQVEETKIMNAYGLTVYGKMNRYDWTIFEEKKSENALITIRITDTKGQNLFSMNLGNNVIFQSRIDDTMDNFLYWIAEEKPNAYSIENQIYKSLCQSDSLFNHLMADRKRKAEKKAEEEKRNLEAESKEDSKKKADKNNTKAYKKRQAAMKKYFSYIKDEKMIYRKPCIVEFEGQRYTSFTNGYSIVLTKEKAESLEYFENEKEYPRVSQLVNYNGIKKEIDFSNVFAEAEIRGYKLKKSEVETTENFQYILHYDGAYYKLGLLEAGYKMIEDGETAEVYHVERNEKQPIVIKTSLEICVVLPIFFKNKNWDKSSKIIIEVK